MYIDTVIPKAAKQQKTWQSNPMPRTSQHRAQGGTYDARKGAEVSTRAWRGTRPEPKLEPKGDHFFVWFDCRLELKTRTRRSITLFRFQTGRWLVKNPLRNPQRTNGDATNPPRSVHQIPPPKRRAGCASYVQHVANQKQLPIRHNPTTHKPLGRPGAPGSLPRRGGWEQIARDHLFLLYARPDVAKSFGDHSSTSAAIHKGSLVKLQQLHKKHRYTYIYL